MIGNNLDVTIAYKTRAKASPLSLSVGLYRALSLKSVHGQMKLFKRMLMIRLGTHISKPPEHKILKVVAPRHTKPT